MIIVCTNCKAKSKLDDKYLINKKSIKVRCKKCRQIFKIQPDSNNTYIVATPNDSKNNSENKETNSINGISIKTSDDILVAILPWESIDISNCKKFKKDISTIIEKHDKVIFDMHNVEFMDSSGCGALISAARALKNKKGCLKICDITDQVDGIFDLIQLHRFFEIFPDHNRAINSFY